MLGTSAQVMPCVRGGLHAAEPVSERQWFLHLLGGWKLTRGTETVVVPKRLQRLIALLALSGPMARVRLGPALWPASTDARAANSLRVALWQASHTLPDLLADVRDPIALHEDVAVDVHNVYRLMDRAETGPASSVPVVPTRLQESELLPDWYDDWVIGEQERLRARRVQTLERLAADYLARDEPERALDCAQGATDLDPLSETSHQLVIESHIGAGNYVVARRAFETFRERVRTELDVEPSPRMRHRLESLRVMAA